MIKHTLPIIVLLFTLLSCETEEDQLIKSATRGNIASRVGAIEKLAKSDSSKALKAIVANLGHRNSLVRRTAARALAGRDHRVAWPLIHRLKDGDVRVRKVVIQTLFTLPPAPFIYHALVGLLDDPARQVRATLMGAFRKAGFPLSDLLTLLAYMQRLKSLDALSSARPADRTVGVRTLGELGTDGDQAFWLPYLRSKDPFLYQSALKAAELQSDPELLNIYLRLPSTEQRNISILRWLTLQEVITQAQWTKLLSSEIQKDLLISLLPQRHPALSCDYLAKLTRPEAVKQLVPSNCPLPETLSLSKRIWLAHHLGKKLPESTGAEILKHLTELRGDALAVVARQPQYAAPLTEGFTQKWEAFLFHYTKWIPGSTWERLSLVGPAQLKPQNTTKLTPREKLLSVYRKKVNVFQAKELLPPRFDLELFQEQLQAVQGLRPLFGLLIKIVSMGPPPLQSAALAGLTGLRLPLPKEVLAAAESEERSVRIEAIRLIAMSKETSMMLKWLKDPNPRIRELVLKAIETTGDPKGLELVMKEFTKAPTARLAALLGKLKVKKALPEMLSLLKEDTSRAMDKDRAGVLASLANIAPSNLDVRQVLREELFHPSHLVVCEALRHTQEQEIIGIYARYAPSLLVRRCAAGLHKSQKKDRPK